MRTLVGTFYANSTANAATVSAGSAGPGKALELTHVAGAGATRRPQDRASGANRQETWGNVSYDVYDEGAAQVGA